MPNGRGTSPFGEELDYRDHSPSNADVVKASQTVARHLSGVDRAGVLSALGFVAYERVVNASGRDSWSKKKRGKSGAHPVENGVCVHGHSRPMIRNDRGVLMDCPTCRRERDRRKKSA